MSVTTTERPVGTEPAPPSGLVARGLLALVRSYQLLRSGRPTGCRFVPSCSEFAVEAVTRHGPARGTLLAARRLARCGPWGGQGVDPVPEPRVR
jgi:uncharacterized protein